MPVAQLLHRELPLLTFALGVEQRAEVVEQVELASQAVTLVGTDQVLRHRTATRPSSAGGHQCRAARTTARPKRPSASASRPSAESGSLSALIASARLMLVPGFSEGAP